MNYLAHARLSFNQPEILVGNVISDFVKGNKRFDFSAGIQQGIMLHRSIDMFTDQHSSTKEAKQFFKPAVGLYAGAFVDITYDHFLATDEKEFTKESLINFSSFVYETLDNYRLVFPPKFARLFPFMRQENWLYNYSTIGGTEKGFNGLIHRAKFLENNNAVFDCFKKNYTSLQHCYKTFFPDIKNFVAAGFLPG